MILPPALIQLHWELVGVVMAKRKRRKIADRSPRPVDVHVGRRVRLRRTMLGMNQTKLGEALGLSFHMVQKYERGKSRISASRLYDLSNVLNVPVSFFFDDMPPEVSGERRGRPVGMSKAQGAAYEADTLAKRETLELCRAYSRIKSDKARKRIVELTKTIAKVGDAE